MPQGATARLKTTYLLLGSDHLWPCFHQKTCPQTRKAKLFRKCHRFKQAQVLNKTRPCSVSVKSKSRPEAPTAPTASSAISETEELLPKPLGMMMVSLRSGLLGNTHHSSYRFLRYLKASRSRESFLPTPRCRKAKWQLP